MGDRLGVVVMAYGTPASPADVEALLHPHPAREPAHRGPAGGPGASLRRHRRHLTAGGAHRGAARRARGRPRGASARPVPRRAGAEARAAVHRGRGGRRSPTTASTASSASCWHRTSRRRRSASTRTGWWPPRRRGASAWRRSTAGTSNPPTSRSSRTPCATRWPRSPSAPRCCSPPTRSPSARWWTTRTRTSSASRPPPSPKPSGSTAGPAGRSRGSRPAGRPIRGAGPDILDVIRDLAATGRADGVLVCPQGFVSDHLEVVYDLDIEAAAVAEEVGLAFARTRRAQRRPRGARRAGRPHPRHCPMTAIVVVGGGITGPGRRTRGRARGSRRDDRRARAARRKGAVERVRRRPCWTRPPTRSSPGCPRASTCAGELGIDGDLVSPSARRAHVWSRGALRLLPEAQVLGVPTDLDELAGSGILSDDGLGPRRRRPRPCRLLPKTSPSERSCGSSSATRRPSGWSTRWSAASTPATPTGSAWPPPSRSSMPPPAAAPRPWSTPAAPSAPPSPISRHRCSSRREPGWARSSTLWCATSTAAAWRWSPGTAVDDRAHGGASWHVTADLGTTSDDVQGSARSLLAADGVVVAAPAPAAAALLRDACTTGGDPARRDPLRVRGADQPRGAARGDRP